MASFAVFLRAVNVGGTGKLPMKALVALCEANGCREVRTYIQSGNVVLVTDLARARLRSALQDALAIELGKPVGVVVRTRSELSNILADNPFPTANPSRVIVMLADKPLAPCEVVGADGEQVVFHGRELYIHYPQGQGRSKLKLPAAYSTLVTGRNLNTLGRVAALFAGS